MEDRQAHESPFETADAHHKRPAAIRAKVAQFKTPDELAADRRRRLEELEAEVQKTDLPPAS